MPKNAAVAKKRVTAKPKAGTETPAAAAPLVASSEPTAKPASAEPASAAAAPAAPPAAARSLAEVLAGGE
jgi:hypothetical protein